MKIYDLYEMSSRSLWRRKLRSGLTILGVVIGTASIVMMFSLSEAMNVNYKNQMNQWGELSLIEVMPKDSMGDMVEVETLDEEALIRIEGLESVEKVMPVLETSATLQVGDYGTIQAMTIVGYDRDEMEALGYEVKEGRMYEEGEEDVVIVGGNIGDYLVKKGEDLNKKNITSGRNTGKGLGAKGSAGSMKPQMGGMSGDRLSGKMPFSGGMPDMEKMKEMLGENVEEILEEHQEVLPIDLYHERAMLTFETFTFRMPNSVKGILNSDNTETDGKTGQVNAKTIIDPRVKPVTVEIVGELESGNTQTDGKLFVPRTTLSYLMTQKELQDAKSARRTPDISGASTYNKILVKVEDSETVEQVKSQIEMMGYKTDGAQETLEEMKQMSSNIQVILLAIGAISLIVAAIGITNTMMTSIYERTKEIGIMKVIGATIKDIKNVFLVEAAIIGFLGGVVGISLCCGIAYMLNTYGKEFFSSLVASTGNYETYVAVITPYLAIGAVVFATVIGILSGYMPASKATSLSALSAMKND